MAKPVKALTHRELMKPYLKDKEFVNKIELGVKRLKVISQIVELRENLELTQAELAARMGVSQAYIARIENDAATNLSLETLLKIATALKATCRCLRECETKPRKWNKCEQSAKR
jgi:DNA-binding XRE family transcriptional regulator